MITVETDSHKSRRPIKTRSAAWVHTLARALSKAGFTPNQISISSIVCACASAALMIWGAGSQNSWHTPAFVLAALAIQLRLLCNLLDGLMAVEGGQQSILGNLFNEFPDRISDSVVLIAAGYVAGVGEIGIALGWLCALLALGTAYVRAFAAQCTRHQDFSGPMAKQQRMFCITAGLLASAFLPWLRVADLSLVCVLVVVAIGSAVTCLRRTLNLAAALSQEN